MSMDYEYLADSLSSLSGLPVRLYRNGRFQQLYHHIRFKPDPALSQEAKIFRNPGSVSYYMDENFLCYGLFRGKDAPVSLVIGPVAQAPLSTEAAVRILRSIGEPANRAKELTDYFSAIPTYPLRTFLQILCTVSYFINGEKTDVAQLLLEEEPLCPALPAPRSDPLPAVHSTMELETLMLSHVEHGRTEEIRKLFHAPAAGQAGPMAADALRQQKNLLICTATLVTRAAIRGGLGTETAFAMSDMYIKKAELLTDLIAVVRLNSQMVLDFTKRVEAEKCGIRHAGRIRKAREYILAHIGDPITTEILSRELGINRTYLCRLFREETGMTPGVYVANMKIAEARRLMDITQKSASEIAAYLGYSSQSHFQRVFKSVTGLTPGQYRRGTAAQAPDQSSSASR